MDTLKHSGVVECVILSLSMSCNGPRFGFNMDFIGDKAWCGVRIYIEMVSYLVFLRMILSLDSGNNIRINGEHQFCSECIKTSPINIIGKYDLMSCFCTHIMWLIWNMRFIWYRVHTTHQLIVAYWCHMVIYILIKTGWSRASLLP